MILFPVHVDVSASKHTRPTTTAAMHRTTTTNQPTGQPTEPHNGAHTLSAAAAPATIRAWPPSPMPPAPPSSAAAVTAGAAASIVGPLVLLLLLILDSGPASEDTCERVDACISMWSEPMLLLCRIEITKRLGDRSSVNPLNPDLHLLTPPYAKQQGRTDPAVLPVSSRVRAADPSGG